MANFDFRAGIQTLLTYQQRQTLESSPGWFHWAMQVHRTALGTSDSDADHPGVQLVQAMGRVGDFYAALRTQDSSDSVPSYIQWYSLRPAQHLRRIGVSALGALRMTLPASVILPALPNLERHPQGLGYVRSTQLALRWLEAMVQQSAAQSSTPLVCLPDCVEPVDACQESTVRVLLQAGEGGAVAVLRLRAVRQSGAHLMLVPMPGSICLLLDQDFGHMLEVLAAFLRQALEDRPDLPRLLDVALAWDLAPAIGETTSLAAIEGDSAGAAFACAALLALTPYAPAELHATLHAAREAVGEAFMSAAIDVLGQLHPVSGLTGKTTAVGPLAQALNRWAGRAGATLERQPLYLAPGPKNPARPASNPWTGGFVPTPVPSVTDLLGAIAQRAEPPSPVHEEALALVLPHPTNLPAAAAAFAQKAHRGLAQRLSQAPVRHWKHLAVRDLARWEHQGGPLQTEFVQLRISARSGGAWGDSRYDNLPQLLAELDGQLQPIAFVLEGPPGAGKTTLLRHHMQALCHTALCTPGGPPGTTEPTGRKVLPLYVSLASWDDTAVPGHASRTTAAREAWMRTFVRQQLQRQLSQEQWAPALAATLNERQASTLWSWRWLLDGLNEVPHPASETRAERARAIVQALKAEFGVRLPMLLTVRENHMSDPGWVVVKVEPWDENAMVRYLGQRFAEPDQLQPGLAAAKAERVLGLIRALPESSRSLYTRPMALSMLCDVYLASPAQGLPANRAALYTATLWFYLRRELGLTRQAAKAPTLFQRPELLSPDDRAWVEQAASWPASPEELPQGGLLLRGLMDQADAQYWSELNQGKTQAQRCTVAVPLSQIELRNTQGKPVGVKLRQAWLQAAEAVGLADAQPLRKGEFRFAHQSWGEFLASVRLLSGSPQALQAACQATEGRARRDAQARWRRIFEQTRVPEAGRADSTGHVAILGAEAELQGQDQKVSQAWGAVPQAVWQRLLDQGLSAPLEAVIVHLSPDKAQPVSEARFWEWTCEDLNPPLRATLERADPQSDTVWPDGLGNLHLHPRRWADWASVAARIGQADWSARPIGWLTWYQSLWPPFQRAFDAWLRVQPEFADPRAPQRVQDLLASQGRLDLPPPADTREVLTLALTGLPHRRTADWLAAIMVWGDWRATVPAALLLRSQLEAAKPGLAVGDGHWFDEPGHRHPVLQHLRRLLLLRAVDAGAAVRKRLRRSGVLAALTQPPSQLQARPNTEYPALRTHWQSTWQQAFAPGAGVDLRERLQAGLWLGELGDNLRYLRWEVSAHGPQGTPGRVGICLHPRHWCGPGRPGQVLAYRLGDAQGLWADAKPEWTAQMPAGRLAAYPVTVMEWAAVREQDSPSALQRAPSGLTAPERCNPLMPITGANWFAAQALADWYRPVYHDLVQHAGPRRWLLADYSLSLPTEVQREAFARGPVGSPLHSKQAQYTYSTSPDDPPLPLVFNHHATRWHRPNPVGVFSRGLNPWGLDDLAGNVWNWCSNASTPDYQTEHARAAQRPLQPDDVRAIDPSPLLALRGGSFYDTADLALAAFRDHLAPGYDSSHLGLRWQMSRPIFEP